MESTITFKLINNRDEEIKRILNTVYAALEEKGYNPVNQIVGYILSEDPTYITTHNNARSLMRQLDRDDLLQALVRAYIIDEATTKELPPAPDVPKNSGEEKE